MKRPKREINPTEMSDTIYVNHIDCGDTWELEASYERDALLRDDNGASRQSVYVGVYKLVAIEKLERSESIVSTPVRIK